jgi:ABC-type phosphate transport system ATPase subunit
MITLSKVSKWYANFQVLNHCSTEVAKGEVVVVCGPSGSGKSTHPRRRCASPNTIMWLRLCLLQILAADENLSDFRRTCVGNRKILLQMKF